MIVPRQRRPSHVGWKAPDKSEKCCVNSYPLARHCSELTHGSIMIARICYNAS